MPTTTELQIVIEAQDRASTELQQIGQQVQRLERQVAGAGGAFGRLGGVLRGLGTFGLAGQGLGQIVDGFQRAFGAVGGLVQEASDLNEQVSRAGVVFGEAAGPIQAFAQTTGQALGISRTQALEAASSFGTLFRSAGVTQGAAADMSEGLVRLAADLASFNNLDPSDTLEKLRSGLVGEAEPLRAVGVLLSEEAVKQKAFQLGLATSTNELSEAVKVQARYALILDQTRTAQGDFQRTSTGLANTQRILRAAFTDIRTELGGALLPTVSTLAQRLVQQLPRITKAVQDFAKEVAPILEKALSGDIAGALADVGAKLKPVLATWSEHFWTWVESVKPELLKRLEQVGGAIFAWISEQTPLFLATFLGEWVPAFVEWLTDPTNGVLPKMTAALGKMVEALLKWGEETGIPELKTLGTKLGTALHDSFLEAVSKIPALSSPVGAGLPGGPTPGQGPLLPQIIERARTEGWTPQVARPDIGTRGVTIAFGPGAITMGGVNDPGFAERLKAALTDFLTSFVAAGGQDTISRSLQGAGR